MRNEIAYKRLIANVLENSTEDFPVLFTATNKEEKNFLLKSVVRKGKEVQDQQDVCAMFKLLFTLKDIKNYTVIFPTILDGKNLVVITKVDSEMIESQFLQISDSQIVDFPDLEVEAVSQGLFTRLLPNETSRDIIGCHTVSQALIEFWDKVLFEVNLKKLDFTRLQDMFSG